jgi:hypothetical protein
MEEAEPDFEHMSDGQLADYGAGLWKVFTCPKCGLTDVYEGQFGFDYEERDKARKPHILTERNAASLTKREKEEIRKRDNHTCQLCGAREKDLSRALDIHHVLYNYGLVNDPKQFVSLCQRCHGKMEKITMLVARREGLDCSGPKDQRKTGKSD